MLLHAGLTNNTPSLPPRGPRGARQARKPGACRAAMQTESPTTATLSADVNFDNFWGRYRTSSPERMSGWVGHFASYGAAGSSDKDIRFQDIWLRLFREDPESGAFQLKMVRQADQSQRSWPRAGRERPDGNDETVLEGTRGDSSSPKGFWHPYGRGPGVPEARVVCPTPDVHVQVTLQLPSLDSIASKAESEPFAFLGGVETSFFTEERRRVIAVTYKAGDNGGIMFHQASWDPTFVSDVDPESEFDIAALLEGKEAGHALGPFPRTWGLRTTKPGEAITLTYRRDSEDWEVESGKPASLQVPTNRDEDDVLYTYPGGMYAVYPRSVSRPGPLRFEQGCLGSASEFRKCTVEYDAERWVQRIRVEKFSPP